jgi:hypothetical protein
VKETVKFLLNGHSSLVSEELFNEQEECNHARKVEVGAMVFVRSLSAGRLKTMSRLRLLWSPLPGASARGCANQAKKERRVFRAVHAVAPRDENAWEANTLTSNT